MAPRGLFPENPLVGKRVAAKTSGAESDWVLISLLEAGTKPSGGSWVEPLCAAKLEAELAGRPWRQRRPVPIASVLLLDQTRELQKLDLLLRLGRG
jgi:hypothetical protein